MGITQANNTATDQEVGESASGTHITKGNSELAGREDRPADAAMLNTKPHKTWQQVHQEVPHRRAKARYVARHAQERVQAQKLLLYKDFWKAKRDNKQLKDEVNGALETRTCASLTF